MSNHVNAHAAAQATAGSNSGSATPLELLDSAREFGTLAAQGEGSFGGLALTVIEYTDAGRIDSKAAGDIYMAFSSAKDGVSPENWKQPSSFKQQASKVAAIIKAAIKFPHANAEVNGGSAAEFVDYTIRRHKQMMASEEGKKSLKFTSLYSAVLSVCTEAIKAEHTAPLGEDEVDAVLFKEPTEEKPEKELWEELLHLADRLNKIAGDKADNDNIECVAATDNAQQWLLEAARLANPTAMQAELERRAAEEQAKAERAAEKHRKMQEAAAKRTAKTHEQLAKKAEAKAAPKAEGGKKKGGKKADAASNDTADLVATLSRLPAGMAVADFLKSLNA